MKKNTQEGDPNRILYKIPGYPEYLATKSGNVWSLKRGKWLPQHINMGYLYVSIHGKRVAVHQILGAVFLGTGFAILLDHANRIRTDNRLENLRPCTMEQNLQNCSLSKRNKSGFKGVYPTESGKWRAVIGSKGKTVHLGTFAEKEEAARAYDEAARRLHGAFAATNFQLAA